MSDEPLGRRAGARSKARSIATASPPGSGPRSFLAYGRLARCASASRTPQFKDWLTKNYQGVIAEALAELGRGDVQVVVRVRARGRPAAEPAAPTAIAAPALAQPQVHLRELRGRLLQPVRPRRRARGGRDPVEVLQPALPLRRRGPRQDPPDARDRPLHPGAQPAAEPRLHLVRPLHQRDDQRHPLRPAARLPPEVPRRSTCCWSTTSSSSPARTAPRRSSSTSSTRSTTRRSRS